MTPAIFYISSIVFSATAIFALWQLGLKKLMLDDFRDSLFSIRDRVYALAQTGQITCNDPAYRAVEQFVNLTIRYAHRFTFLSFAMTVWHLEGERERETFDPPSRPMIQKIALLKNESVRIELQKIVEDVSTLLPNYIAKSSLMFMLGSVVYVAFRSVSPVIAKCKSQAVETFEVEAYRDAKFESYSPA